MNWISSHSILFEYELIPFVYTKHLNKKRVSKRTTNTQKTQRR